MHLSVWVTVETTAFHISRGDDSYESGADGAGLACLQHCNSDLH